MHPSVAIWVLGGLAAASLLTMAAADIRERIIPNRLVLAVMGAGFALRLLASPSEALISVIIWVCVLGGFGFLASRSLIGWGDAKMIPAVTLLAAPGEVPALIAAIAISGGVLALVYLAAQTALRRAGSDRTATRPHPLPGSRVPALRGLLNVLDIERARILAREPMPYGVAILGGVAAHVVERIV